MKIADISTSNKNKHGKIRVYVWPKGETILNNLAHRRTRPYTEYKKLIEPSVKEHVEKEMGQPWNETKLSWNQKAGCGCGCSPGFILNNVWGYKDLHITITE